MKTLLSILLLTFFVACSNKKDHNITQTQELINQVIANKDLNKIQEETKSKIDIYTLPFFSLEPDSMCEDFRSFYYNLVKSCQNRDTTAVLNSIYDTLRFSQYECAHGLIMMDRECDNCSRCSKEGMLAGTFYRSNIIEICDQLFELITKFGIGHITNNEIYNKWIRLDEGYVNFNFNNWDHGNKYFNYNAIIPLKDSIEIKEKPDAESKTIGYVENKIHQYVNEPGMGLSSNDIGYYWLKFKDGYIDGNSVLSGFEFTLVIFEKTYAGWKITGFVQPPGC